MRADVFIETTFNHLRLKFGPLCLYVYQPVSNMTADILNSLVKETGCVERSATLGWIWEIICWFNTQNLPLLFFWKQTHSSFYVTVPLLSSQTSSCISVALHDDYTVRAKCYLYPFPKKGPFYFRSVFNAASVLPHCFLQPIFPALFL